MNRREEIMRVDMTGASRGLCVLAWLAAICIGPGAAAEDFYKGKSISFIIASAPGGGYDTYSRLVAGHIGKHLAGQPSVVPQNMPGASSVRAAVFLYSTAPKDGTAIGMVDEAIYLHQLLDPQEAKTDATRFNWVGRILPNSAILFARSDAQVQKTEDIFTKELIVSASGAASKLNWTVLKNLLGVKFTILSGYQGSNDSMLAMLRGEVDALSQPWSILKISGGHLLQDKKVNLLLQTGAEKDPDLPQLPRMIDLARTDEERQLLELFASPSLIGRSVLAPPGLPPERVAELRRAFMATMKDPAFLEDVKKAKLDVNPMSGEELQAAIEKMGNVSPALLVRARQIAGMKPN
jgi:tripartite-type tricarboxylate transporter receptor subunit TctC